MLKKLLIIGSLLVVVTLAVLYFIPWGEYESELEKSELNNAVEYTSSEEENLPPSLDELEGTYKVSAGETAEILFHTDGLKTTKGGFKSFDISFTVPDDYTQSNLSVTIQTKSINTGNSMRDEHLMEEGFFEEHNYPTITFSSNQVVLGDTSYVAKGEMTMNGTTLPLDVPFLHLGNGGKEIPFEAFEGAFSLDRIAFGQSEEAGVGNIVNVNFYCELIKE